MSWKITKNGKEQDFQKMIDVAKAVGCNYQIMKNHFSTGKKSHYVINGYRIFKLEDYGKSKRI